MQAAMWSLPATVLQAKIAAETDVQRPRSVQRLLTADTRHVYRFRATVVMASLVSHVRHAAFRGFIPGNTFCASKDIS